MAGEDTGWLGGGGGGDAAVSLAAGARAALAAAGVVAAIASGQAASGPLHVDDSTAATGLDHATHGVLPASAVGRVTRGFIRGASSPASVTVDWLPAYPDFARRDEPHASRAPFLAQSPDFTPPPAPTRGEAYFPDQIARPAYPASAQQALAWAPADRTAPIASAVFPDAIPRSSQVAPPAHFGVFVEPRFGAVFPDRIDRPAPPVGEAHFGVFVEAPTEVPPLPSAVFPDIVRGPQRSLGEAYFGPPEEGAARGLPSTVFPDAVAREIRVLDGGLAWAPPPPPAALTFFGATYPDIVAPTPFVRGADGWVGPIAPPPAPPPPPPPPGPSPQPIPMGGPGWSGEVYDGPVYDYVDRDGLTVLTRHEDEARRGRLAHAARTSPGGVYVTAPEVAVTVSAPAVAVEVSAPRVRAGSSAPIARATIWSTGDDDV